MDNNITAKKRLENRFNIWVYIALLYISFLAAAFFESEMAIYGIISQLNLIFTPLYGYLPYSFTIILRLLFPLFYVGLFEIASRIFYRFANFLSLGAISMPKSAFTSVLRMFVILENVILGILNLLYYFFNFIIPLGMTVLSFAITSGAYLLFFMYINKYYLDPKTAHRAFRVLALFYLVYSFISFAGGLFI